MMNINLLQPKFGFKDIMLNYGGSKIKHLLIIQLQRPPYVLALFITQFQDKGFRYKLKKVYPTKEN